jgi:sn-glycerol 3-phosphate transport system permease protein
VNDSRAQIRFERLWTRGVLLFVLLFTLGFVAAEREGLLRLVQYLTDAVARLPVAVSDLVSYYRALPPDALGASLLTGGMFGSLATVIAVVPPRLRLDLPPLPFQSYIIAAAVALIGLVLRLVPLPAVALAFLAALVAGLAIDVPLRHAVLGGALRPLWTARGMRIAVAAAGLGFAAGAIGGQLLTAAAQHCTYLDAAPANERSIGQGLTLASALVVLVPVWTLLRRRGSAHLSTAGYFRGRLLPYLLLAPTLVSLFIFLYAPAIQSLTMSLRLRRFPLPQEAFVCLRNYTALAEDAIYRSSVLTTFGLTVAIVAISLCVSLAVAVLASQRVRGAAVYRTLLIWPFALSPIVTGAVFLAMFREGGSGLINSLLAPLGISPSWMRDASLAPWVIVAASVWNILGFNILFYIAGLQNVPPDLLEAAQIDGADRRQRFQRVTLPLLAPYTFFLLVTNITYSFYGIYGVIDALTQGGPPLGPAGSLGGATNALIYKLYQDGFAPGAPLGLASAQAVVLFVMVAALTILQFRVIETRISYAD